MSSTHTVPIHLVHRALRTAEHRGIDLAALLREAGIRDDLLGSTRSRITADQMTHMTQALWRMSGDELFGLGDKPVPRGTFRLLSMAVIHSPDLGSLLRRFEEHSRVIAGVPPITVSIGEEVTRIDVDITGLDDPEFLLTDTLLVIGHRLAGWLIGRRLSLRVLELPYPPPPYSADYDLTFGCLPTFGTGRAAFGFDSSLLTTPIVRSEDELTRFLRDSPGDVLARRDYGTTTSDQVRAILERGLVSGWPTSEEVAGRLAISLQHLRRKLREEGTSVSHIKGELIRDAAVASLARGDESMSVLAQRLGFSDARAFRRAFLRWTGSAPSSYRPEVREP